MNIYQKLNQATLYIEDHLDDEINYGAIAQILDMNIYTMQKLFPALVGVPLAEYIRRRKLSSAACDLLIKNWRVIDLAAKYGYSSNIAFSRAFTNFHGIRPSQVKSGINLRNFPRVVFDETLTHDSQTNYSIIERPACTLYGVHIDTTNETIKKDAPRFFCATDQKYLNDFGHAKFGMVSYRDPERNECSAYHVLYDRQIPGFEQIKIPASRWLKFIINSYKAREIQEASDSFYTHFLPSSNYQVADLPELEYYHDGVTEFWVPVTTN